MPEIKSEIKSEIKPVINILVLHGCNQTESMCRSIFKPFIELAETYAKKANITIKWHFIEAKYAHPDGGKTWYSKPLVVSQIGSIPMDHSIVDDTLADIDKIINDLNINVLFGFSQGGNVVDTYLMNCLAEKIKCAVIFSGYDFIDTERKQIDIPVMNVCSDADEIVPSKFMPVYQKMVVKKHDKGHKIPTSKPFQREILDFVVSNVI